MSERTVNEDLNLTFDQNNSTFFDEIVKLISIPVTLMHIKHSTEWIKSLKLPIKAKISIIITIYSKKFGPIQVLTARKWAICSDMLHNIGFSHISFIIPCVRFEGWTSGNLLLEVHFLNIRRCLKVIYVLIKNYGALVESLWGR